MRKGFFLKLVKICDVDSFMSPIWIYFYRNIKTHRFIMLMTLTAGQCIYKHSRTLNSRRDRGNLVIIKGQFSVFFHKN